MKKLVFFLCFYSQLGLAIDTFSLEIANDLWTGPKTDRLLTNVLKLAIRTKDIPSFLKFFLPNSEADYFLSTISQDMYTPENIELEIPDEADRPYAGHAYVEIRHINIDGAFHDYTTIQVGIIGPAALAGEAQAFVHKVTGSTEALGWEYQLKNELGLKVEKLYGHKTDLYEWELIRVYNISFAEVSLGNVKTSAGVGTKTFIGYDPPRNDSVYDLSGQTYSSDISLFLETDYRYTYVARDMFVQGNSSWFGKRTGLELENYVTQFSVSVVGRYKNFFLRVGQHRVTEQSPGQNGDHQWGAISLQYRMNFNE